MVSSHIDDKAVLSGDFVDRRFFWWNRKKYVAEGKGRKMKIHQRAQLLCK